MIPYGGQPGYLAEGRYARPVPEVRYDVHGTAIHYELTGRYRGLLAHEASALSDALYHDLPERQCERTGATLPPSPCLLTLRKRWGERAAWDHEDDVTSVDQGLFYDWGQVAARNYNEG